MKSVVWVGSSKKDLMAFPAPVVRDVGFALYLAQQGETHPSVKPLKGFGGAGVVEIVERHDGDAWRVVYTARSEERVYVLHAFQKKSPRGRRTSLPDVELIRSRLKVAEKEHRQWIEMKR